MESKRIVVYHCLLWSCQVKFFIKDREQVISEEGYAVHLQSGSADYCDFTTADAGVGDNFIEIRLMSPGAYAKEIIANCPFKITRDY